MLLTGAAARPRPLGITLLASFFAFGTSMCVLTTLMLLAPASPVARLWVLNPTARVAFQSLGPWSIVLMLVVGTACAAAAAGLWLGRSWGRSVAIGVLAVQMIGDLTNVVVRHDRRTLVGLPVAALLLWYLFGRTARDFCARAASCARNRVVQLTVLGALCAARMLRPGTADAALVQEPADVAHRIDAYLQPFDSAGELSGDVLVAKGSTVLYERSFGRQAYPRGKPNRPGTLFNIASVTKPLTEIIAAQLMDQGKLAAADAIGRWLPTFPQADRITVEQLLSHRAGIPHRVTTADDERQPQDASSMTRLAAGRPLLFEPGAQERYSSAGYSVLARVLELAGGASYADLLERLVLVPAGAKAAGDATRPAQLGARAASYRRAAEGPLPADEPNLSYLVGAGSVYATPRDLLAIVRALLEGKYGTRARERLSTNGRLSWNGLTDGYRAFVEYDESGDLIVIATLNLLTGAADLLRENLPRLARGEPVPSPQVPHLHAIALSADQRADYMGVYARPGGPGVALEFLSPTLAQRGTYLLVPVGPDHFFSTQDYAPVRAERSADGTVTALQWGAPSEGPRFERVNPP